LVKQNNTGQAGPGALRYGWTHARPEDASGIGWFGTQRLVSCFDSTRPETHRAVGLGEAERIAAW